MEVLSQLIRKLESENADLLERLRDQEELVHEEGGFDPTLAPLTHPNLAQPHPSGPRGG